MNRTASIQRMAGVGMAEPMGRHKISNVGAFARGAHDSDHLRFVKTAALAGPKQLRVGACPVTQRRNLSPCGGGEKHRPRLSTLAGDFDLASVAAVLHVPPQYAAHRRDPEIRAVEEAEQDTIAADRHK